MRVQAEGTQCLPGIGKMGEQKLRDGPGGATTGPFKGGITNAAQVVGWYMRLGGNRAAMRELLVDVCGCHGPSIDKAVNGAYVSSRRESRETASKLGRVGYYPRQASLQSDTRRIHRSELLATCSHALFRVACHVARPTPRRRHT